MAMLGAYQVLQKLGEGGMGEVLLGMAPDRSLVVLKVPLHPSAETTARLRDEARVGFRLRHPHIVRTRDFFMAGNKPVLVIDFVDGASLKDLREQRGPLPPAVVAHIGRQVASALSFIHTATDEHGKPLHMLHRDVTPGNILVNRRGDALLIDLGIARSDENTAGKTSTGILKGTFRYLCPDLFTGSAYSSGTDLWALGVTLFESAMGRKAATGGQQMVLAAIIGGRIMQLHPGEQLHPLLFKTFQALLRTDDPSRRITDAAQLERVFAGIVDKLGDGAAEAEALMRAQPQGDVSGEFGADDLVPTIYDGQLGGISGASSSDVFTSGSLPSMSPSTPPPPRPTTKPPPPLPPGLQDNQGPTQLLPRVDPIHPPRPPTPAPAALPTLAIPLVVVEEDIDMSDFDAPAAPAVPSSSDAPPTMAIPAGQLPSQYAPPTVILPAGALPSLAAPPTVMLSTPMLSSLPTLRTAPPQPPPTPVAPAPIAPASEDAPRTIIAAAAVAPMTRPPSRPITNPQAPRPSPPAPPPVARPTLELPIFVDDDDPPRE
jgi:serine/threonine protein kinase